MPFHYTQEIKFRHCDPAGIVFYPRFFEMMNDTVEAFFAQRLGFPFAEMFRTADKSGVPTAQISASFLAPVRLGDVLDIELTCTRLGSSSLDLSYSATCDGTQRFTATSTIVFINADLKSQPWPEATRALLAAEMA